jgi:hypothetical protein
MNLRTQRAVDPHRSLHSDTGGLPGEHPGRSRNPRTKIAGLAWLEFEKPDLARAERFLLDFAFTVADRTPEALVLRGHWRVRRAWWCAEAPVPGSSGRRSPPTPGRTWTGWRAPWTSPVRPHRGGYAVDLTDPSGFPVRVVHGVPELPAVPERAPLPHRSSGSGTLRSAPPGSGRRWTGTWTPSG